MVGLTPESVEVIAKLFKELGPVLAVLIFLAYYALTRSKPPAVATGEGAMSAWQERWETRIQQLNDRVIRLEATMEGKWDFLRMYIIPQIKQPTHHHMDYLLDKLKEQQPMSRNDLEVLRAHLHARLEEEEPKPYYHLFCYLTLDMVNQLLRQMEHDPEGV